MLHNINTRSIHNFENRLSNQSRSSFVPDIGVSSIGDQINWLIIKTGDRDFKEIYTQQKTSRDVIAKYWR